jgi:hypothetical protein
MGSIARFALALRILGITVVALGTTAVLASAPAAAAEPGSATCDHGSIAAGTYSSLTVAGFCSISTGSVTVSKGLELLPGAALIATTAGSDVTVGRNLVVGQGAIMLLGCEPTYFPCSSGGGPTDDTVGGNLVGDGALMMVVHHTVVRGNLAQSGGGGGVTCDNFPLGSHGPPAYSDYEDNAIGGNASISGLRTCYLAFIRNHVSRNVNFDDNTNADPDGNEVVTNTVAFDLNCSGNSPAPQVGDSNGSLNSVGRRATGQCAGLVS